MILRGKKSFEQDPSFVNGWLLSPIFASVIVETGGADGVVDGL